MTFIKTIAASFAVLISSQAAFADAHTSALTLSSTTISEGEVMGADQVLGASQGLFAE